LNVALARLVDLKAALLAETRARAALTDRTCARAQLARCSRDQLRRRMGHSMALRSRTWSRRRV
jgi:hypothetical protein